MGKKKRKNKEKKTPEQIALEVWEQNESLHGIIHKENWDFITVINKNTKNALVHPWLENFDANLKNGIWEKHLPLIEDCYNLGKNKATVGIGSGPSFNKNKEELRWFLNSDGVKDWRDRAFVTICANHQFKPLLEFGIIPDFVLLVDNSDVVYDQLCRDIPKTGKNTVLIAGMHCDPKTLKDWSDQGRDIRLVINTAERMQNHFKKRIGKDPKKYLQEMGGNVLNGAWAIACQILRSYVFLAVGNDLSFEIKEDLEEQKKGYYADGDYSTNAWGTGTGRDEGKSLKKWGGFKLSRACSVLELANHRGLDKYNIDLDIVGTAHTLWVYKNWLESTIVRMAAVPNNSLHYFNCTEGGILGVMAKDNDTDKPAFREKENWYMLDEKCRCYHTAMLKDAMEHFIKCKEILNWQIANQQRIVMQ